MMSSSTKAKQAPPQHPPSATSPPSSPAPAWPSSATTPGGAASSSSAKKPPSRAASSTARTTAQKRLMSELQEERKNPTPQIYINFREENIQQVSALIIGPQDTPYAGGFFRFAISVPDTYPHTPPRVRLETTDGGRVRFNPNLYACGKVCLSILGTWSGPPWNSCHTISSVLLSIQSLMNNTPIRNEPGLCNADERQVNVYNKRVSYETIRVACIQAMRREKSTDSKFYRHVYNIHFLLFFEGYEATVGELKQWIGSTQKHHPGSGSTFEVGTRRNISGLKTVTVSDLSKLHAQLKKIKQNVLNRLLKPKKMMSSCLTSLSDVESSSSEEEDEDEDDDTKDALKKQRGERKATDNDLPLRLRRKRLSESRNKKSDVNSLLKPTLVDEEIEIRTQRMLCEKEYALANLTKQYSYMKDMSCSYGCAAPKQDDYSVWNGTLFGPIATPYEGGIFPFEMVFPISYPSHAPFIRFVDCTVFHPNVTSDGIPAVESISFFWKDSTDVNDMLKALAQMLTKPAMSCIVNKEAGLLYMDDRKKFNRRVRDSIGL